MDLKLIGAEATEAERRAIHAAVPEAEIEIRSGRAVAGGHRARSLRHLLLPALAALGEPPAVVDTIARAERMAADDPSFADADLRLNLDSPVIDAGDSSAVPMDIVDLDEERKANMVSNLLVVLCGEENASPVVNTGSLYS